MKKSVIVYVSVLIVFCAIITGLLLCRNQSAGYHFSQFPTPQIEKINLNTATNQQLQMLPGIGPSLADRIISYREENGPFETVEDVINVKGIGMTMLPDFLKFATTGE